MKIVNDSFTCVVLGDWNNLYTDPTWISRNILNVDQIPMELGFSTGSGDIVMILHGDGCNIQPTQSRFVLTCTNLSEEGLMHFETYCRTFLDKAKSPYIKAYGFNVKFIESDVSSFASTVDSLPDNDKLTDAGAIISSTQIVRKLKINEHNYGLTFTYDADNVQISINQHNECNCPNDQVVVSEGTAKSFLDETIALLEAVGYKKDEEE